MKKILIAGAVLVVAVVAVLVLTVSNLGPIVKKAINEVGPKITKTKVNVDDVNISIFSGEAKITDFLLGNPTGFKSDRAVSVGSVYVDVDESTITKDTIVINKIEIVAPQITYEKISGTDNFQALLKNVKGSAKAEKKAKPSSQSDAQGSGKKIVINEVVIRDGKVNLTMAALAGKTVTASLPEIRLKDIGKESNGATPAEAFEQIFDALYENITSDAVTSVFNDGLKQFGVLKDMGTGAVKDAAGAAQKALDSATQGATEGVDIDSAAGAIKGMFNRN